MITTDLITKTGVIITCSQHTHTFEDSIGVEFGAATPSESKKKITDRTLLIDIERGNHEIWIEALRGIENFYAKSSKPTASEIVDAAIVLRDRLTKNYHVLGEGLGNG